MDIEYLPWDSDFFQVKAGRAFLKSHEISDFSSFYQMLEELSYTLVYLFADEPIDEKTCKQYPLQLTDKKTTYIKTINKGYWHPSVFSVDTNTSELNKKKLIELAYQSGIYSRFRIDERMGDKVYKAIYKQWMLNSLNRTIAFDVLAYAKENEFAGMITLGEKNNRADIGLIAIDEHFRGMGIATKLIQAAENVFYKKGYSSLQVVTQGDNFPACKLYESYGFVVEKVEYVYHLWL